MKNIYFDLVGGASGDMLLSSLIELGAPLSYLEKELKKLDKSFSLKRKKIDGNYHIPAKELVTQGPNFSHAQDIIKLIKQSSLEKNVKESAVRVYQKIVYVERKVHKVSNKTKTHLHHLGKADAVAEICGFFIALEYLKIENILVSEFPLSFPAPATLALLKGKIVSPVKFSWESVTPTAAALLNGYEQAQFMFQYEKSGISWGKFGKEDCLVAYLYQVNNTGFDQDVIYKVEVNIDDMNPQWFERLFELLYQAGAKEVYLSHALMKKMRPGWVLTVLCLEKDYGNVREIIFKHTTTFGLRFQKMVRDKLPYKFEQRKTSLGKVQFRVSKHKDFPKAMPEYRDCLNLAQKRKISLL